MTDELTLEGLEALEQAATPGPWEVTKDDHGNEHVCDKEGLFIAEFADGENEDLVIALRNAAPSLFARIRQAERERDEARRELAESQARMADVIAGLMIQDEAKVKKMQGVFEAIQSAAEWMPLPLLQRLTDEIGKVMEND